MWRGQASTSWKLETSLHFQSRKSGLDVNRWESTLTNEFLAQAPSRADFVDPRGSRAHWLVMMRHHGLPTRLLDWTWSPLTAVYFAVTSHPHEDAFVWTLDGAILNQAQGLSCGMSSLFAADANVKDLIDAPFTIGNEGAGAGKIFAVIGPHAVTRIARQDGIFTLHGTSNPLEELPAAKHALTRFKIPASAKSGLQNELDFLGVNRKQLFPDLDSLAADLAGSFRQPMHNVHSQHPASNADTKSS